MQTVNEMAEPLVHLHDVAVGYDPEHPLIVDVDVEIVAGDVIAARTC